MEFYIKGAPEKIKKFCKDVPTDFDQVSNRLSIKGYRLLALAYKKLGQSIGDVHQLNRAQFENDLEFVGFLIIENKLKEDTSEIMNELKTA